MSMLRFETPTGLIAVHEADETITNIEWLSGGVAGGDETPLLLEARRQIEGYFAGSRRTFDLPLAPGGTGLRRSVWDAMRAIPFGAVRTYGDIARELGASARAVGAACGRNPIPIVIPCHRVVGAGGRLTGFSGGDGIKTKHALLRLEGAMLI